MLMPRVTDHALIRYLERVKRVDVEAIRSHIATLCAPASSVRALSVIAEGVCFQLQKTTVVTVTPYTGSPNATKRRQVREGQ